jgi:hypothetical protein
MIFSVVSAPRLSDPFFMTVAAMPVHTLTPVTVSGTRLGNQPLKGYVLTERLITKSRKGLLSIDQRPPNV